MIDLRLGDCLDVMRGMDEVCVDSIITDPPYGLSFMGKDWDHGVPGIPFWEAALRVAKPGAFLLAFGGTRTHHRLICAIEDAGWEIRDAIFWVFGSGFPKSHDISKAIDKAAGAEREVVGIKVFPDGKSRVNNNEYEGWGMKPDKGDPLTSPATPAAELWDGWGTALKPAHEIICVAMKPIEGTFAENALEWGVAGLAIDKARIPTGDGYQKAWDRPVYTNISANRGNGKGTDYLDGNTKKVDLSMYKPAGRWPANVILDEEAAAALDQQSGILTSGRLDRSHITAPNKIYNAGPKILTGQYEPSTGGASRFFYCAKSSRSERDAGLEGMPEGAAFDKNTSKQIAHINYETGKVTYSDYEPSQRRNIHPCVKPLALMRYLCTLTSTPTGGVVLDPFMGSGSTGIAAKQTGRDFIGIEISPEYYEIARRRIEHAQAQQQTVMEFSTLPT